MIHKNLEQLKEQFNTQQLRNSFKEVFGLHFFFSECILPPDFQVDSEIGSAIFLTSKGEIWARRIREAFKGISDDEIKFALFSVFGSKEVLIDIEKTDTTSIKRMIDILIRQNKIKFPWIFDRLLYDRYFDLFPDSNRTLSYQDTSRLLDGTPKGVFQVNNYVIGPFGLLESVANRTMLPTKVALLWHCPEPYCESLHEGTFLSGENNITKAINYFMSEIVEGDGETFDLTRLFVEFDESYNFYDDRSLEDFPWLLINAFSANELKYLLKRIIDKNPKTIRTRIPIEGVERKSSEQIVDKLDRAEVFQLILLESNEKIIYCLEALINEGVIRIPSTEVRSSEFSMHRPTWYETRCEISKYGIRIVPKREAALSRLKRLIYKVYQETGNDALQWKLRAFKCEANLNKLEFYLHSEEPRQIISNLILAEKPSLTKAFEYLQYGQYCFPNNSEEEKRLIDSILWRLGFDIGLFPDYQKLFWERLDKFKRISLSSNKYNEDEKEDIRSAAVNFFVSLEEILDYSLSFLTWALFSDHYAITRFQLDFDDARQFMASKLTLQDQHHKEPIAFDGQGRNTLYPLIKGFGILAGLCEKTLAEKEKYRRPDTEFPGYHKATEIDIFPFIHTVLLLDIAENDQKILINQCTKINEEFTRANICDLRNRLEHKRKDFPEKAEIIKACELIEDIVKKNEIMGVNPLIYYRASTRTDQFGRKIIQMSDYFDRRINVFRPSQFSVCRLPSFDQALIIGSNMHISNSLEVVRFAYIEKSDYTEMWRNYPKKRIKNSQGKEDIIEIGKAIKSE